MPVWPNGQHFAFTIVDDTDRATVENVRPVYDVLADLGMRTTKTAWMFRGQGTPIQGGATCEDSNYLEWLLGLQRQGFEIAMHNAAPCTSPRDCTGQAIQKFQERFGRTPFLFCNHVGCRENIYWGSARLSDWRRSVYELATHGRNHDISRGHVEGDPLFWGDLCREHVRYVRNFVFNELNTLAVCPEMPYHDPSRPYVNYWFASAGGATRNSFLANFTYERIERLVRQSGLCIVYTHLAHGFAENGSVHPEVRRRLEYLAGLKGWFAPASKILDYLRGGAERAQRVISPKKLRRLERRWLFEKLLTGTA